MQPRDPAMTVDAGEALRGVPRWTPDELRRRTLELLGFDRIRGALAAYTGMPVSRDMALALEPSYDADAVRQRQRETAEGVQLWEAGAAELAQERDVRPLLERAARGGMLTGQELVAVGEAMAVAQAAKALAQHQGRTPLLRAVTRGIPDLRELRRTLERKLTPSGELADDATPYLRQLRHESRASYRRATEALDRFLANAPPEVLQERLVTVRSDRLVVPVKAEFQRRVRGIVHDISDSGATLFLEPLETVPLTNSWRERTAAEGEEVERTLRQLSAAVARRSAELSLALELSGRVDLALAKARYAAALRGSPVEPAEGELRLVEARHPLLPGTAVPVSLHLAPPVTGLVITGPNTGGKTVALKALGLAVLMHQAGLRPPVAETTRLPVVDGVYADIGDQQSVESSLSTFSSHITAIAAILRAATDRSLVLFDELGTSTDPEEGSALARAILVRLAERGVRTVVTTHHRAAAVLAEEHAALENASVELDAASLQPTYRLTMGIPGRSYAMAVAERLGLDAQVVSGALELQDPAHRAADALLANLQEERYRTRQRLQEAGTAREQVLLLQRALEQQLEEAAQLRADVVERTRQELLSEARAVRERLKRLETAAAWAPRPGSREAAPSPAVDGARRQVEDVQRLLRARAWGGPERRASRRALAEGDLVEVAPLGMRGTVVSAPPGGGRVEVLVGSARIRVDAKQARRLGPAPQRRPPATGIQLRPDRPLMGVEPEVDLRGMGLQDAMERLDHFLDDALAEGRSRVRVVHGKGTGVLRDGVWRHLAGHRSVGSYAFAARERGGDGATEVELA